MTMIFTNVLALFLLFAVFQEPTFAIKKVYVVYLGGLDNGPHVTSADLDSITNSHSQLLSTFLGSEEKAKDSMIYSYNRHINGFAALLEEDEAAVLSRSGDVVSVFMDEPKQLHTTHSWDFLALEKNGAIPPSSAWNKARFGEDSIIANLDTGVWPESKSFSGEGYGPVPSKWKGTCQTNDTKPFCNRKLIGARYFSKGFESFLGRPLDESSRTPRDVDGHGSHTLSTAGGNFVRGASVFGAGNGTAKGGSPRARVAAYKVCWPSVDNGGGCFNADILEAFEAAIQDGVDVISLSLGGDPANYLSDANAIGAFHAVQKGIAVVASAGNSGPTPGSVSNGAPWIITVGASTVDRQIEADVYLKNGAVIKGTSISEKFKDDGYFPLVNGEDASSAGSVPDDARFCLENTLDPKKVRGAIVVCVRGQGSRVAKGAVVKSLGGVGLILANDEINGNQIQSDAHVLPATMITYSDSLKVFDYIKSTKNPEARITSPVAVFGVKPSPFVGSFSSRGPNTVSPQIIKPDITAPGVSIIAAYTEGTSPSGVESDKRVSPFNSLSGTSMSCPHVSGVVGLLKTLHPDWSPSAIKSAIMTTAYVKDNTGKEIQDSDTKPATPFAFGSGHIDPGRAVDPGLVYDLTINDYLDFLCGIGYNPSDIARFSGSNYRCPRSYNILDFNYPSISIIYVNATVTVTRKLKNVGQPGTYTARAVQPIGYSVTVEPSVLKFEKIGEEKSFKLTVKALEENSNSEDRFGEVTWSDGPHVVRSPISVTVNGIPGIGN